MKIGILTYHAVCNFGANLQVLSTISFLKNAGHDPIVINWYTKELEKAYKKNTPAEQFNAHIDFQNKYLPLTERCYSDDDICASIKKHHIDALIIGSDAVVQHHPFLSRIVFPSRRIFTISKVSMDRMCPNPFWGSFYDKLDKKIPMVMMSVSSQNSAFKYFTKKERGLLYNKISNFSHISVRDDWTSQMISIITQGKIKPDVTPDPVFAFNYNVKDIPSKEYILKKFNLPSKYYLLSFLNSKYVSIEWLSEFEKLALKDDISCVVLPFPQGIMFHHPFKNEINIPLSPIEWYSIIKYSQGYVGNNMHPIVVSLHNNIPCFSFDNYGVVKLRIFVNNKSSKIYHIMKKFGVLSNRIGSASLLHKTPRPSEVTTKLKSYNRKEIEIKSKEYLTQYIRMMDTIIKELIK